MNHGWNYNFKIVFNQEWNYNFKYDLKSTGSCNHETFGVPLFETNFVALWQLFNNRLAKPSVVVYCRGIFLWKNIHCRFPFNTPLNKPQIILVEKNMGIFPKFKDVRVKIFCEVQAVFVIFTMYKVQVRYKCPSLHPPRLADTLV